MSFSTHANNKTNHIYVLVHGEVQGINGNTIYKEKGLKTNFTERGKKFVLSLHYNGDNFYLFANGIQQLKFKTKNSEIKKIPLTFGNITADWCTPDIIKTSLHGNVYDFAVDYEPVSGVKVIYDIHRYLMTKHNI